MVTIYIWGDPQRFRNYSRAVTAAGGSVQFGGDPTGCDGLLLSGGGDLEPWRYGQENRGSHRMDPERDERDFRLLEEFLQRGKMVLGICRGLQVINVFFDGTLIQDLAGHSAVDGKDRLHEVSTTDCGLRRLWGGERIVVNSAHHQAVDRVGEGLQVIQRAEDGTIEGLRHERLPILALQWHPERLQTPVGAAVFECFLGRHFSE